MRDADAAPSGNDLGTLVTWSDENTQQHGTKRRDERRDVRSSPYTKAPALHRPGRPNLVQTNRGPVPHPQHQTEQKGRPCLGSTTRGRLLENHIPVGRRKRHRLQRAEGPPPEKIHPISSKQSRKDPPTLIRGPR